MHSSAPANQADVVPAVGSTGGGPVSKSSSRAASTSFDPAAHQVGKPPSTGCPVSRGRDEPINPANAMPLDPKQAPAPGQRKALPTGRATSTIPSAAAGSEDTNWVYPSQQMFFNAMRRKGYAPHEEEMDAVVAIHNAVNERAWGEIVAWESTLHPECAAELKLRRFVGKPDEPTPKARARALFGYSPPFDRHDWTVMRCGKEVTYLLDFYRGQSTPGKPVAMYIDARPAAEDWDGVWDRVRMPFVRMWHAAASGRV